MRRVGLPSDAQADLLKQARRASVAWMEATLAADDAQLERARAVRAALDAGCSTREVGRALGCSHVRVQQLARLVDLPSDAQDGDAA